jgi:hypothetical protein
MHKTHFIKECTYNVAKKIDIRPTKGNGAMKAKIS